MDEAPALIAIGGLPGSGKTTVARRLSTRLGIPCLSSDVAGGAVRRALPDQLSGDDAFRAGYEVLFTLAEEFLAHGGSVIVDLSLGWPFQWQRLDAIQERRPHIAFVPVLLRCPREVCVERIEHRRTASAARLLGDRPEVWNYVEALDRPDLYVVDAVRDADHVLQQVLDCLERRPR
jgi:predicted kinase